MDQVQQQYQEQQQQQQQPEVLFANINANDEPVVLESLCPDCEKMGKTTIMLTKIPMFKELIVTSFYCEECGNKNSEVQFGGKLGDYAQNISLKCTTVDDFKRDVVRSEFSTLKIPELDFEIPANKKGQVNNIEGFMRNTIEDLESEQEKRKLLWPDLHQQIAQFINTLNEVLEGKHFPFHFQIDDPAGNSYIKNPFAPKSDPNLIHKQRVRTIEECQQMGFNIQNEEEYEKEAKEQQQKLDTILEEQDEEQKQQDDHTAAHKIDYTKPFDEDNAKKEALSFPITCHVCMKEGANTMCIIDIPYFKEVTIMSFNCEHCGAKNSDVKVGGAISDQGIKISLTVEGEEDLKRDLFKSETCGVSIPELDIELIHGTLGGVYTTVEGLLEKIQDNLCKNNPFADSDGQFKNKLDNIKEKIEELRTGNVKFTLVLEDMLENSFIQNPYHPKPDINCSAVKYDRTDDMNDELGLKDMKV